MAISNNEPIQRNSEGEVIQPKPYLGSPSTREVNRSMGGFEGFGSKDSGKNGLSIDQLSRFTSVPTNQSSFSSPVHAIPQSELIANKRYESYNRDVDLENVYGLQQSWADQLANGVVKMAGVGVGTFLQSFATIPNTISAMKNGKLSDLSGGVDGYESSIDTWVKNIEDYFPNYMTRKEQEHPLLGIIPFAPGSANFWGDKIIKNLGFTAGAIGGAIVQDLALGAVTGGLGEIPGIAAQVGKASLWLNKVFTGTNDLEKVLDLASKVGKTQQQLFKYKQLGELAAATKVANGFKYGMSIYGSARTEAAIEARDSYTKVREELISQYKLENFGQEPTGDAVSEIENYATDAMNTRFGINMALLTASNSIQFGNLFKSFSSASKGITGQVAKDLEDVGKIGLKEGSKDVFEKKVTESLTGRIWESVRPKMANVFAEGVYEEGGQFAAEKGAYDYYTRKYRNLNDPNNRENWNSVNEIINSTTKGLKDQFGTSEGLENMVVGAISALISGGIMGKVDQIKGQGKDARLQASINTLNRYGLTGILTDNYGDTLDAVGIAKDMEAAVKSGNIYQYKNLKHDMFFNFVQSRIPSEMHDVTIEQLNMLKDLDKDEFEKSFGMDFNSSNKKTVNDYVDSLISQADDIKKTYDSISTTFKNPFTAVVNPKTPEEELTNQNHNIFENWKKELTYLAAVAPDTNSRLESIQQSVSEINPLVTNDLLSTLSNDESLRTLSKSYEEKANQLNKTITEYTSAEDKKSIKQQVKALRTASERIQLGLTNGFDTKSFDYLLNFELNNQDPTKERVVRPEFTSQLNDYGYDIERLKYRKERASELFDLLSDEAGFKKYFDQAEQIGSQEPPEEKPEQLLLPAATPQFKNKTGETEAVVAGKEYEIPASKKAKVDKLADDRWQVTAPDGSVTFHDSKEKADEEATDINEEFGNLQKVKVVAVNEDGRLKVEDLNGDIYDIYPSKLDGYERIETEQEKLQKFAEDIDAEQKEIELKSGDVATGDLEKDISAITPYSKRKPRRWLYISTSAMSESKPELLTPHALRAIAFRNDAKTFPNRADLRIILVTQKQEEALGLKGLANLSMRSEADHTNLDNGFVGAVYVEQASDGLYFVNQKGERVGKVGDGTQVDLNKVVFDTMPDTSIYFDNGANRYREEEMSEEEALAEAANWRAERKKIFEQPAQSPKMFSFVISRGIPTITDAYQRNAVGKTLIDEDLISSQEGLIVIPTTGTISHQGEIINFPNGRPVLQYGDTLQFLNNKKFNKNQAEAIFEVMNQMAKGIKKQADAGKKIKIDRDYTTFLQNVLYLRKTSETSNNQFYIDTATMELFFNGERYDITNLEESREDIVDRLQKVYNNVNNTTLKNEFNSPFTEYYIEDGKLESKEWTNYQSYLLSSKDADGKPRPASEIPLTTAVTEKSDFKPYNYEQKYSILEGMELSKVNVAPAKAPEVVVTPAPVVTPEAPAPAQVAPTVSDEQKVIDFIGKRIQLSLPEGTVSKGPETYGGIDSGKIIYTVTPEGQVAIDGTNPTNLATIKIVASKPASMAAINAALNPAPAPVVTPPPPVQQATPVSTDALKDVESFETAKGSVYTVLPNGKTQRFKTATGEQNEPNDLIVFVKFENAQQEQDFLYAQNRQDGKKLYVVDSAGNVYDTNEQVKGKDVKLAIIKDGKVIETVETSLEPKIGYNTFDQRRYDEKGEKYRSTHLGNKVTKINYKKSVSTDAKADIERRRKESLNSIEESYNKGNDLTIGKATIVKADGTKESISDLKDVVTTGDPFQRLKGQINAVYNAELAALEGAKPAEPVVSPATEVAKTYWTSSTPESIKKELIADPNKSITSNVDEPGLTISFAYYQNEDRIDQVLIPGFEEADEVEIIEMPKGNYFTVENGFGESETFHEGDTKLDDRIKSVIDYNKQSEKPSTPPVGKKNFGKAKRNRNSEYRRVGRTEKTSDKITDLDLQILKEWHAANVPNLPYEVLENIVLTHDGERAYGVFEEGVAKFYKGAIRGTEYHEIFEGIWKAFLNSEQREVILDEFKAKEGTFVDRESGKKIPYAKATNQQAKERIADDFADFRLGKMPARSLGAKILKFFRDIIEFVKKFISKPSLKTQLFNDINTGKFKDKTVPTRVKNALAEYKKIGNLSEQQANEFVQDITANWFQIVFGENRSLYDINRLSSTDVFGQIKEMYEEDGFIDNNDPDVLSESEFAELADRSKEFLRTFKINFREDDSISVNEEGADRNEYARETFNTDWKKYSPFAIKILMGTMVERESNNVINEGLNLPKPKTTDDGLLKLLNFSRTFATAMDRFTNTTSASKLVDKLKTLAKEDNNYVALFKRLGGNISTGQIDFSEFKGHDWRLFVNFYQTFTKQKPEALIQYITDGDTYTSSANLFTTISKTKQSWIENMKGLSKVKDSVISLDYENKMYKVKDVSKLPIRSTQDKLDFLAKLGITFPIEAYGRLKSTAENDQKKQFNDAVSSLRSYLGAGETELMSLSGEVLDVNGPLDTIAELLVKVTNPNQDMTYFGIDNKRIQSYADSNSISVLEDEFNSADTLDDLLNNMRPELKDIFSTSSQVLKKGGLFFNKAGKRIKKLKVEYIQGTSITDNKDISTSKLDLGNRFVQEMNQNINGNYYVLVPADSATEWMMNLGNTIKFSSVESGKADDQIHEIFKGYLEDDIALAMANRTSLRNVANRARELRFFKDILPEKMLLEINALVINRATKDELTAYLNKNEVGINTAVDNYIEALNSGTLRILEENNQVSYMGKDKKTEEDVYSFIRLDNDFLVKEKLDRLNLTKDELDAIIKFTNVNYVINNIEYHKILFGDPYQFAVKDGQLDETKRIKSFLSPRRRMFDTPEFNTFLNQKMNMAGDIKLSAPDPNKNTFGDPGYHLHKAYTNTVTLNDVEIVGSIATLKNIPKEIQDKFAKKAKETDGASWIMDTTYREVKMKNGQWDFEGNDEKWHQWQMAYTRQNMPGYTYTNEALKEQDAKLVAKPMPKFMIDVLKPIVSGNRKNATGIELVLDKFSQMPIYFSMVQGTNLEQMYIKMWKEQRGYAVVLSGRKVGAGEIHNIYNSDGSFNQTPFNNLVEVPWSSYGLQVENAYDGEKEQTRGSQITKLASVDLFDNGVPVSDAAKKEYDRNKRLLKLMHENGYKNLLKKLGIQDLGTSFSLPDNIAVAKTLEYELLRRELSTNAKDTVRLNKNKQFSIPFEASTAYKQIRDVLFSMVDKAIVSPKMSGGAHVQVPVTMWENAGNRELIIKEDDGTWKKLTPIQYNKLSEEQKKKVVFTDTTLKFYTREDPYCEILLPHWFKVKLGKSGKFKTEKDLITYLNGSPEGKSILKGIGFRIPTQSLSSVEVFRVKGFLPESMGHTVVVPSEIVTKAGSDFDIDKLNMYLKATYVDAFGDIKLVRYLDNEEKTKDFYANVFDEKMSKKILKKEELREAARILTYGEEDTQGLLAKYSDILNSILDEYQSSETYIDELDAQLDKLANETFREELKDRFVDDMYKKSIENEYYDSLEKLITLPENFNRLISPVDDAGLKALSEELDKLRSVDENKIPNRILDRNYMTSLRHAFITAKKWVGIAAVNITGQSLTQKSKVYIDPKRFENLSEWEQILLGDGSIALDHNTVEIDGKRYTSISGIKTADGKQYISDRLSGYATAFVDVAKDPYIMKLIQSEAAVGTFMFLERIGAGKAGVFFMNQPIIVEYLKDLDSYGSKNLFNKARILEIDSKYGGQKGTIDINNLEKNIGSKYLAVNTSGEVITVELDESEQLAIFWEFLKYAKMAEYSFKLTQATNYDTTKFRSSGSLFRKQTRTEKARQSNIFTSVDEILGNSFIGDQSELTARAFEGIGTILKLDQYQFRAIINKVLKPFANNDYLSADNYAKVENKIVSAFLDYIIQTKSELSSEINALLVNSGTSVAAKLAKAKEDHPDMQIVRDLEVASSQRVDGPKSIQLSVNLKTGYDEDLYIGMMRELRDNPATNSLYKDIVKVAVLQGSYQSAISLKNIIPLEDYSAYVAPYIAPLIASPDVKAFADGYFQRNNFRDGEIFTVVNPKFFINKQPFERVEDVMPVSEDQFGNPIYQYLNIYAFPNVKVPGVLDIKSVSRKILVLNETFNYSATQDDFIVVPRVVTDSKTGAKVDMVTGRTVTDSMLSGAKKKGNMIYKTVYGYQKVRHEDGTPVTFTSEYMGEEMINHVYKLINLYGDNPYTTEFYPDFRKSVLDNGTAKIDAEIPDRDIINYFAPQLAADMAKSIGEAVPSQPMGQTPATEREYTPEKITKQNMPANGIFVFGSNTEGRHGLGAAKDAKNMFGAVQGQAEGLQGQSYAIITKDLAKGMKSIPLFGMEGKSIAEGVKTFVEFANNNPDKKFYVTKIGSKLAGYTEEEIKNIFDAVNALYRDDIQNFIPDNVILPREFEVRTQPTSVSAGVSSEKINIYAGTGENAELSNFAIRPFVIGVDEYRSVEQYFQYQKWNYLREDVDKDVFDRNAKIADAIMRTTDGGMLRSFGKKFLALDTKSWDENASKEMKIALKASFEQNPEALQKLIATGNATLTHTQDKGKWGKEFPRLLMEVREELRPEQAVNEYGLTAANFEGNVPDYAMAISNFYESLTPEQKIKLGSLEDIIADYESIPFDYSYDEYIKSLNC
jgi:predicted NAD-dependent protein-ADP-ribosyltransferase YbiA (DUF1768 family)